MSEATPTPRTDKALTDRHEPKSGLVWGDFARQLERELAKAKEDRRKLLTYGNSCVFEDGIRKDFALIIAERELADAAEALKSEMELKALGFETIRRIFGLTGEHTWEELIAAISGELKRVQSIARQNRLTAEHLLTERDTTEHDLAACREAIGFIFDLEHDAEDRDHTGNIVGYSFHAASALTKRLHAALAGTAASGFVRREDTDLLDWFEQQDAIYDWTLSPGIGTLHHVGVSPQKPRHEWKWHKTFREALTAARAELAKL